MILQNQCFVILSYYHRVSALAWIKRNLSANTGDKMGVKTNLGQGENKYNKPLNPGEAGKSVFFVT